MSDDDDIEATKAPLIEHLIELRSRLIKALIALFICAVISGIFAREIYDFLTAPLCEQLIERGQDAKLIYTQLYEKFFVHLKIAVWGGVFLGFPLIAAQLWMFVAPGLYKQERGAFLPFLIATPVLFLMGASLVYFFVMPMAISFFLDFQTSGAEGETQVQFLGKVNEYLSLVMTFIMAFGICFQLPVLLTLIHMVFGYAKVATVVEDRRSMILAAFRGALFVVRHPVAWRTKVDPYPLNSIWFDFAFAPRRPLLVALWHRDQ